MVKAEVIRITHATPPPKKKKKNTAHDTAAPIWWFKWNQGSIGVGETPQHVPGHNARDPSLAPQHVGRDPLRVLDALEEATIGGGCPERGSRAEKKCSERDAGGRVGVELDR